MNELLVAFLLLIISVLMFAIILAILKLDRKIIILNEKVNTIKNVDFGNLQNIVATLNSLNSKICFDKLRRVIDGIFAGITLIQIFFLYKKLIKKIKSKNSKNK